MRADRRIWRHIIITTYGAWLHGDPRSFRTRHHREHINILKHADEGAWIGVWRIEGGERTES